VLETWSSRRTTGQPRRITISTVIEQWNIGEVERLLDWCAEQGFVLRRSPRDGENAEFGANCKIRSIKRWWTKSSSGGAKEFSPLMARRDD